MKPIIGKKDDLKYKDVNEQHTELPTSSTSDIDVMSPNVMGNINIVMQIWDEYSNRTHRIRNAVPYVMNKIPDKTSKIWNPDYIRTMRSVGSRLRNAGVYDQARHEDWSFVRIIDFLKWHKKQKLGVATKTSKIEISRPTTIVRVIDGF